MAIAQTGSRNLWAAMTRVMRATWFGDASNEQEIMPIALNNEAIRAPNAAGTAYVNMIKVNASNQVEIPTTLNASAGIAAYGGAFPNAWALNYTPVATTTGTNSAAVTNQAFIGQVWVPVNQTFNGVAFLIGTTGGTDKAIVALYDSAGNLLANSTTTGSGTTVGTGSTIQSVPFTSSYAAKGPGSYFLSVQYSGQTAKIQTIPLGVGASAVQTATVAAPLATITVPTTFAANASPVASLY